MLLLMTLRKEAAALTMVVCAVALREEHNVVMVL